MTYQGEQATSKQDVLLDTSVGTLPCVNGLAVAYDCTLWIRSAGLADTFTLAVGGQQIASSSRVPHGPVPAVTPAVVGLGFPREDTDTPIEFTGETGDKVKLDYVLGSGGTLYYRLDADPM